MKTITLTDEIAYERCVPRFWASCLFSIPFIARDVEPWLGWLLATCALLTGAWPFFEAGFKKMCNRYTLISLSILLLYGISVLQFLFSDKPIFLFNYAAYLIAITLFGLLLQQHLFDHILVPLNILANPIPAYATRLSADSKPHKISSDVLRKGDCVQVHTGETLAVDGVIISGNALIDERLISAKKEKRKKGFGDFVFAGTVNLGDPFVIQAKRTQEDTLIMQIAMCLKEGLAQSLSENHKIKAIKQTIYPVIIAFSILSFFLWLTFSGMAEAAMICASILIIANPKAYQVSASIITIQAMLEAIKEGIVIRNSAAFDSVLSIDTLIFEKTKILTKALHHVHSIEVADGVTEKELLYTAASLEQSSQHPIAVALVKKALNSAVAPGKVEEVEEISGLGIRAKLQSLLCLIGDEALIEQTPYVKNDEHFKERAKQLRKQGYTVIFCSKGEKVLGIIAVEDPLLANTEDAVRLLKKEKISLFCLSADRQSTVSKVASRLKLDHYQAEVKPEQKSKTLQKLKKQNKSLAIISDHALDPQMLEYVDLAIGIGLDVKSKTPFHVMLLKPELFAVHRLYTLATQVRRSVNQSIFISSLYNGAFITFAAFGLFTPITSALIMIISMLAISIISMKRYKV